MVTAGVFMVCRLSPLFELAPTRRGRDPDRRGDGVSSLPPSASPSSTSSGWSPIRPAPARLHVLCRGVGAYSAAMFHLMTHAFFKALLFLGSGSVITACITSRTCARWAA
jgi:NADH-quinone oxidoreductase subunit L